MIRRVSWGAILAGAVVALIVQLMLSLLGLAIGLALVDPATEANPLSGLGWGSGIWLLVSTLLALFAGGFVAGRLAGRPRRMDGALNGIVSWTIVTFITFYLSAAGVGALVSGALNVAQQGVQLLGQGVQAAIPNNLDIGAQIQSELSLQRAVDQAASLLLQSGPEPPQGTEQELRNVLTRWLREGRDVDRQRAIEILTNHTALSQGEVRQLADQLQQTYQQATQEYQQATQNIGQQAQQTAGNVASAVSSAALWAFVALVLGALAAAAGGAVGAPKALPAPPDLHRE